MMKYSEAISLLNRKSVKFAIKLSNFFRDVRRRIFNPKSTISEVSRFKYEPTADPVRTWSNLELKKSQNCFVEI